MSSKLIAALVCASVVAGCVTRSDLDDRRNDPLPTKATSCERPCFEGRFKRNDYLRNDPL